MDANTWESIFKFLFELLIFGAGFYLLTRKKNTPEQGDKHK